MTTKQALPLFPLGRVFATPGALESLEQYNESACRLLVRHQHGDWGDVSESDREANDNDVNAGGRLLSSYKLSPQCKLWVITESDRSATTILLPWEY
jgi:hypothetical protein